MGRAILFRPFQMVSAVAWTPNVLKTLCLLLLNATGQVIFEYDLHDRARFLDTIEMRGSLDMLHQILK